MHRLTKIFSKNSKNILHRYCNSSKKAVKDERTIKYTDTINLPKTKFPQRVKNRKELQKTINEQHLSPMYEWQRQHLSEPEFVLHDGPPYANGETHIGHAVNKILKDFVMKSKIIERRRVHYRPGWDCHGLPIELKALSDSLNSPPMVVREKARKFALSTMEKQREDFKNWGVGANWSCDTYKTIDKSYVSKQIEIFYELYKKGLIFRDLKPVYWSPSSKTALAEAELEYNPTFKSPSLYIRLKLVTVPAVLDDFKNIHAVIWTTTPWTLPSNQAVCYNPSLKYSVIQIDNDESKQYLIGSSLVDAFSQEISQNVKVLQEIEGNVLDQCTYEHPVTPTTPFPFLPASHVQDSKGTGLVHTAPGHGLEDYLVCLSHKIPTKCFVDELGRYKEDAPSFLHGKYVLEEGNTAVLDHIKADILHLSEFTHSYPIDWRTKKPVIFRASHQWFIDTEKIKEKAAEEVQKVKLYPKNVAETHKSTLVGQLMKRPYWCISRQRCWGVPIPAFYDKRNGRVVIQENVIQDILTHINNDGNIDFWWTKSCEEILSSSTLTSLNISPENLIKGNDILDIWFDSGISWYTVLESPKIADLYLEGVDQFTGWFQSSLMTSVALRDVAPYRSIFVHGFTVDEKGHKMSKSLGNVIAPKQIIDKYGIDTMRWWIAAHSVQHAMIPVSDKLLEGSAEVVQKLRSVLRYMNGVLSKDVSTTSAKRTNLDKYILSLLFDFDENVRRLYESYQYNHVTSLINNFVTNDISGVYLHLCKDRLYCGTDAEFSCIKEILENIYKISCKAMWPVIPFLVEESWSYYKDESFYKTDIKSNPQWKNETSHELLTTAFELKRHLYKQIKDVNTWLLDVEIRVPENKIQLLQQLNPIMSKRTTDSELTEILQIGSVSLHPSTHSDYDVRIKQNDENLCPRCRRFRIKDTVCARCALVLVSK